MRERLPNIGKAIALVFVIPLLALAASYAVTSTYEKRHHDSVLQAAWRQGYNFDERKITPYRWLCTDQRYKSSQFCKPERDLRFLEQGAKISLNLGVMLLTILFLGRFYAGEDRSRLATVLPLLTRIMLAGLSASILVQAALLLQGLALVEFAYLGTSYSEAFAGFGFVAIWGGFCLIWIAFRIMKEEPHLQPGVQITSENGEGLVNLVNEVADAVGSQRPNNIVAGLEPSFYVTGSRVSLAYDAEPLQGTTLYVPLTFLRILNLDELRSVIGHEMGHFKGKDTEYSKKFSPAYSRMGAAIGSLSGEKGTSLVNVPTVAFLVLIHDEFAVVERKIGREREICADREGARVGSAKGLATALLKFSEYGQLWESIQISVIEALNEGISYDDLDHHYYDVVLSEFSKLDFAAKRDDLLLHEMAHPNDTHPTLRVRLDALGIDARQLFRKDLAPSDTAVFELVSDYKAIARALTMAEYQMFINLGYALRYDPGNAPSKSHHLLPHTMQFAQGW